jgi:uncharacterized membrane protein YjjP (DUF1212 family)
VTSASERDDVTPSVSLADALEVLLRFGALMLQAGNTAVRTRAWINAIAPKLGFEAASLNASLDSITVSVRHGNGWLTAIQEIGPPGVNVLRIAQLERVARTAHAENTPAEIAAELAKIESGAHQYSLIQIAAAVGLASAGFAFINGAGLPEILAAAIGGGSGQWLKSWLSHRRVNHYAVAALAAILASGVFVLVAAVGSYLGFRFAQYPAGFIASILFLVPGFPLLAGLFDLLQYQTVAALSRLAYGMMILLAVAFGLSIVVGLGGVDVTRQPPVELVYGLKLLFRGIASFIAACAFAILFNSSPRTALVAGLLALGANSLRLILIDIGMMPAPAAFFAALSIGLVALLAERRLDVPPVAVTVAPVVIMIPGILAFETIVYFNQGQMLDALRAFASCSFIVGALAMGLATARVLSPR